MAAGDASATSSSATPYPDRLREALDVLSQACESGVCDALEAASFTVSEIVDAAAAMSAEADDGRDDGDATAAARVSEEMLREVHEFLSRPSSNQVGTRSSLKQCIGLWFFGGKRLVIGMLISLLCCENRWPLTRCRLCSPNMWRSWELK
jgi:hypothetical protein